MDQAEGTITKGRAGNTVHVHQLWAWGLFINYSIRLHNVVSPFYPNRFPPQTSISGAQTSGQMKLPLPSLVKEIWRSFQSVDPNQLYFPQLR